MSKRINTTTRLIAVHAALLAALVIAAPAVQDSDDLPVPDARHRATRGDLPADDPGDYPAFTSQEGTFPKSDA